MLLGHTYGFVLSYGTAVGLSSNTHVQAGIHLDYALLTAANEDMEGQSPSQVQSLKPRFLILKTIGSLAPAPPLGPHLSYDGPISLP